MWVDSLPSALLDPRVSVNRPSSAHFVTSELVPVCSSGDHADALIVNRPSHVPTYRSSTFNSGGLGGAGGRAASSAAAAGRATRANRAARETSATMNGA